MKKTLILITIIHFFSFGCVSSVKPIVTTPNINTTTTNKTDSNLTTTNYTEKDLQKVEVKTPDAYTINTELEAYLKKNDIAPYDGLLLTPEATVHVLSDQKYILDASNLALEQQRQLDLLKLNTETNKLQLTISSKEKESKIIQDGQDKEVKRLQQINQDLQKDNGSFFKSVLFISSGVGVGILLGILIPKM
jgi:hypothetical protein